jgi:hypothetical protein
MQCKDWGQTKDLVWLLKKEERREKKHASPEREEERISGAPREKRLERSKDKRIHQEQLGIRKKTVLTKEML